jgi:RNA polymerase sigma-70 factor, ECF subfamily
MHSVFFALNLFSLCAFHWLKMVAVDADLKPLVREARAGEPGAWERLLHRYQLPLYTYAFELVRNEQASLDIVQETFVSAVRHVVSLREDEKFGSWLFGIAHQKCIQHWRRQNRERVFATVEVLEELPARDESPDDLLIRREQEEEFMRLLQRLPLAHREVLLLHFIEDFSIEQIAAITGAPPGTIKSRLHYARSGLRQLIEEHP